MAHDLWEELAQSQQPLEVRVEKVVEGGLQVQSPLGPALLPSSLLDLTWQSATAPKDYLGQQLEVCVLRTAESEGPVVSRRAALERRSRAVQAQVIDRLRVGQALPVRVTNLVDFGAFVEVDEDARLQGLIHISELSWSHVNHPGDVLQLGDTINVKVLDIDHDRLRLSLGLKQMTPDPWTAVSAFSAGDQAWVTVTKTVTFGAFAELVPGVEGLIHLNQLADHPVDDPREVVGRGMRIKAWIAEVDHDQRRILLSLRSVANLEASVP